MPAKSLNSQKDNSQRRDWKAFFKKLLLSAFSAFPSDLKFYSRAEIFSLRFTPPAKDNRPAKQK
jgi:hypothetical protein